jgi:hypothetical protein
VNLARLRVTKVRRFQEPRTADFGKSRIKQSRASFVECLKLLKAIKVAEKVLKAFLKAMTYYQMTNNHASNTC